MAKLVKVSSVKLNDLSSVSGTHVVQGQGPYPKIVL